MKKTDLMRMLVLIAALFPVCLAQSAAPDTIIVHSKYGGQIFGWDIDQTGTEGILAESRTLSNGKLLAAVETFSQTTGAILRVVQQVETGDDFVTMGVVGNSIGLFEHEHVQGLYVVKRTFNTVNPLDSNKVDGSWTPPIGSQHIIMPGSVSRNQGNSDVAVYAYDNSSNFVPYVFSSNVGANTFGTVVQIPDALNFASVPPPIAFDSVTNQAILGGGDGCFGCFPEIGLVDTVAGQFSEFKGIGFGFINGIAVDAADGIFCTTTEDDAHIEFYNLATLTGFKVELPGSGGNQIYSGADVEYDAANKLFFVAQPVSSSGSGGSTIYVYDPQGNLQETLNGFSFSNASSVVAMHIGLKPSNRSGFVDGPNAGVSEIQSFSY